MLKVKTGVTPKNLIIAAAAANVAQELGIELTITSGTDGVHKPQSRHYNGEALDFRVRNLKHGVAGQVITSLTRRLGQHYQVIYETHPPHIHVEYDPA